MFNIDFSEFQELIKKVENIATPAEMEKANKKALKQIGDLAKSGVESEPSLPKSKDPSKSGRKGSRTGKHAKSDIEVKLSKKNGISVVTVQAKGGQQGNYYYISMMEFGTSKHEPLFFFRKVFTKQAKEYHKIFENAYEELLKELER